MRTAAIDLVQDSC